MQHHDTALQPTEKVATDQTDWSSLEVAQDPEENSRNAAWPGAFISKKEAFGVTSFVPFHQGTTWDSVLGMQGR